MSQNIRDAFKRAREASEVLDIQVGAESIPMFLTYKGVREAARDWHKYSSDAPFRVPIPSEETQRSVRQLPIETDPPLHATYRGLIEPFFQRPRQSQYIEAIDQIIRSAIQDRASDAAFDAVREFALPIQSRALALLLGMPEHEAQTWINWGIHVFHDGTNSAAKGNQLTAYLRETIHAAASGADTENFFVALNRFEVEGRQLDEDEKLGIANLVFAGGRDTLIHTITFLIAYFAQHRDALSLAARSPLSVNLAVEESIRVVSPLTHIGRVCKSPGPQQVNAGERVSLCWAAANYDPIVFSDPERINLERAPNPHVGFGSGHHACLGATQARAIFRSLIRTLSELDVGIELIDAKPRYEQLGNLQRQVGFERLDVSFRVPS